jgi:hypothetical protein
MSPAVNFMDGCAQMIRCGTPRITVTTDVMATAVIQ